jgi:hypothetical protein
MIELPIVELLGKNWFVDERLKQFRTVSKYGEPIIFISDEEMDDMLSIKEILDNPTMFKINNDMISKLRELFNDAVEGDMDAIEEIGRIYHCEDCKNT